MKMIGKPELITVGGESKVEKLEFKTQISDNILVFRLSGCVRDRRKQLRAIERKYAGYKIEKCAVNPESHPALFKSESIKIEEANKPQTLARIWVPKS